jgi:hypothetical protein
VASRVEAGVAGVDEPRAAAKIKEEAAGAVDIEGECVGGKGGK